MALTSPARVVSVSGINPTLPLASRLRELLPSVTARGESLPLIDGIDLPRGAVVELAAPMGLGRATQLALTACANAQRISRAIAHDGEPRWCGFVDPTATLHAPAVAEAGVALERLIVVRPEPESIAKVAVRMATSRVFAVLVVDRCGVPGAELDAPRTRWDIAVRRLALACESTDTTVIVRSELERARSDSLPVAMRIELTRPEAQLAKLTVVKDRRGTAGGVRLLELAAGRPTSTRLREVVGAR
ncbi:MAG: recombinase A [Deltaproteobacteria bacterium]|nr:recombinase A [Deltaproteobacteria bacterium]